MRALPGRKGPGCAAPPCHAGAASTSWGWPRPAPPRASSSARSPWALDPAGKASEQKAEAKARKAAALGAAIDDYERELDRRKLVKRNEVLSALRRELRDKLGAGADLRTITRRQIVDRIEAVAKTRPGAAGYLRKASTGFFDWLANRGVIPVSPLAGYRKPRRTRAEMVDQPGRALRRRRDRRRCGARPRPGSATLVRICLLTGVRRGEAAAMEWDDLDLEAGEWLIRAEVAKTGRERVVYLAPLAVELLRGRAQDQGQAARVPVRRRHRDHGLDQAGRRGGEGVRRRLHHARHRGGPFGPG